jgi:hypothetical protein
MTCFDRDPTYDPWYSKDGIDDRLKETVWRLEEFRSDLAELIHAVDAFGRIPIGHSCGILQGFVQDVQAFDETLELARNGDQSSRRRLHEQLRNKERSLKESIEYVRSSFANVTSEALDESDAERLRHISLAVTRAEALADDALQLAAATRAAA